MSMENIEVSRIMMPDDANLAGNVHGGTILKMIEEAGAIIATRHCNQGKKLRLECLFVGLFTTCYFYFQFHQ